VRIGSLSSDLLDVPGYTFHPVTYALVPEKIGDAFDKWRHVEQDSPELTILRQHHGQYHAVTSANLRKRPCTRKVVSLYHCGTDQYGKASQCICEDLHHFGTLADIFEGRQPVHVFECRSSCPHALL